MEKSYRSPYGFAKPQASLLHAEAPCNYILGRFAAALQSVFEIRKTPSRFFQLIVLPISIF